MSNDTCTPCSTKQLWKKGFKRVFNLLLVFMLVMQLLPLQAFAAWDGKGSSTDTGSGQVSGAFEAYDNVMTKARAGREVHCVITDALGNQSVTEVVTIHVQ